MQNIPNHVERLTVDFDNDDKPQKLFKSKTIEEKAIVSDKDETISNENDKMDLNKTMDFLTIDFKPSPVKR